ncbi:type II secretion system major pseudopilin GspG [Pseudaestuariivita rosea]|uniref:type II secretion system major pseudopilin GspG n=1 Tax=Pseudaestuariivita rosea TaxID=2763263 RepID=UPI001ABBB90D|nr:type II secretion system major pseudopilin GspG [Pseudaestuariivita rosea]
MRIVKPLQKMGRRAGATILEVLIVLSIIALIAAVVGPRLVGYLGRAKTETAELQVKNLGEAVQLFYIDMGRYPTTSEGLGVLVNAPAGEAAWQGPYMPTADALVDPWGRDYVYEEPTGQGAFTIQSLGRDGSRGGTGEDTDVSF